MAKSDVTVSTRIPYNQHQFIKEDSEDQGITISRWLQNASDCYSSHLAGESYGSEDEDDGDTLEFLDELDWDDLVGIADQWNEDDLDPDEDEPVDVDEYIGGLFSRNDADGLRSEIAEKCFGIELEYDEDEDEEE